MSNIPPIRPRQIIGHQDRNGVRMSSAFMRWLDDLRNTLNSTMSDTISIAANTRYPRASSAIEAGRVGTAYTGESGDRATTLYTTDAAEIATTEYS